MALNISRILNPPNCEDAFSKVSQGKENKNLSAAELITTEASLTCAKSGSKRSLSNKEIIDLTTHQNKKLRTETGPSIRDKGMEEKCIRVVLQGPPEEVKVVVGAICDIDAELQSPAFKGKTLIELALCGKDPGVIKELLSLGANLECVLSKVDAETRAIFESLSDEEKANTLVRVRSHIEKNKWMLEKLQTLRLNFELAQEKNNCKKLSAIIEERDEILEFVLAMIAKNNAAIQLARDIIAEKDATLELASAMIAKKNETLEVARDIIAEKDEILEAARDIIAEKDKIFELKLALFAKNNAALGEATASTAEEDQIQHAASALMSLKNFANN
ncbi:MAG: hypothetical protein H7A39_04585 [Chlamydiales bacterium]|nr:hypothetical protein [Chlamydiales bacterium]